MQTLPGPGSVAWRINREAALLLGGGRALLMQVAHPKVAAGVADHSDFQRDPLARLNRTLELSLALSFGSANEVRAAARQINRVHERVAGEGYSALDPDLLGRVQDVNILEQSYSPFVKLDVVPVNWLHLVTGARGDVFHYEVADNLLRLYVTPDFMQPMALLALLDQQNGNASRLNAERWFAVNAMRDESVVEVARDASQRGFSFPVVADTACRLADRFGALVTPEAVVLDDRGVIRYLARRLQILKALSPIRHQHYTHPSSHPPP